MSIEAHGKYTCLSKDIGVSAKIIMKTWRARKITHVVAKRDLCASRDPTLIRATAAIDYVIQQEQAAEAKRALHWQLSKLEKSLGEFVCAAEFDRFLKQFADAAQSVRFRFLSLLFVGKSCTGKSQRASGFWQCCAP